MNNSAFFVFPVNRPFVFLLTVLSGLFIFNIYADSNDVPYGDGSEENPKLLTVGMEFSLDASEVYGPVEENVQFSEIPDITAESAAFPKSIKLKTDKKVTLPQSSLDILWKKKVRLFDMKKLKSFYKQGKGFQESGIEPADAPVRLKAVSETGKIYEVLSYYKLMEPKIELISHTDGQPFSTKPEPAAVFKIHGKFFGVKAPKIWVEYSVPGKNKIKTLKCKVLKPYAFSDVKGNSGRSCMNIRTGDSEVTAVLPKKWPKGWNPESVNLVLYNGVGAASASIPFFPDNYKFTLTVSGGTGSGDYASGETVQVFALPQDGKVFDVWTGDTQYIADIHSSNTTVIMPASNVTVTAVFKDAPAGSHSLSGKISGDILSGVVVSADPAHSAVTDADGKYTISGLPDGSYTDKKYILLFEE
jgi:hypothetical protein